MINICPECGHILTLKYSEETENLTQWKQTNYYLCEHCLSTWYAYGNGIIESNPQRYFFG